MRIIIEQKNTELELQEKSQAQKLNALKEEEYQKINELEKGLRNFDPEVMIVFGKIPFFS